MALPLRAEAQVVEVGKVSDKTSISENTSSIRVSPNSYFAVTFLLLFVSALLIYAELDFFAAGAVIFALIFVPLFLYTDKLVFDGKFLTRTGIIPKIWSKIYGSEQKISVGDIEQVETQALRALKRGGSVFYRYRTSVSGKNLQFAFASGGEDYRQMVKTLLPKLSEDVLDNRSIELRDYLREPKETLMKAEFAGLPSNEVLENSINEFQSPDRNLRTRRRKEIVTPDEVEKAEYLRRLGNELKLAGHLLQSLEAFRRALFLNPKDAWLIYEYARCLYSFASSERNEKLKSKARAALRLSEIRGGKDAKLLARLGESYFQYGDWQRARKVFMKALSVARENFRSVRGLAEVALREGKIAHVIHHFSTAVHLAENDALQTWARGENAYFSKLNSDEKYMDKEIRRINRLEYALRGKKIALRFALVGFAVIILGIFSEEIVIDLGWTISTVSLSIWTLFIAFTNIWTERSPLTVEEKQ